jgi:hypothetical protein
MSYRPYSRVKCSIRETQEIDNGVSTTFSSIQNIPFIQNITTVGGVVISSTEDTYVAHKLGKPYRGYFVVKNNAPAVIYESSTENKTPNSYAVLRASVEATVTLMFF